jgi:hypothetical protein
MDHLYLLKYRDYGNDKFLPSWSEQELELGNPRVMSNGSLIEWIERQLETPAQTTRRHQLLDQTHEQWHDTHPGVHACCFRGRPQMSLGIDLLGDDRTVNQIQTGDWQAKPGGIIQMPKGAKFEAINVLKSPRTGSPNRQLGGTPADMMRRVGTLVKDHGEFETWRDPSGQLWDLRKGEKR